MDVLAQVRAHEQAHADELRHLRSISFEERAAMFDAACRAVAEIVASRSAAGLPPLPPHPWPHSTLEFLKRSAADARRAATGA
jgi:hypothetical protein